MDVLMKMQNVFDIAEARRREKQPKLFLSRENSFSAGEVSMKLT